MFIAERFISGLVKNHRKLVVPTDGGGTWYLPSCKFPKPDHHLHNSSFEKSLKERKMQYNIDRVEGFDEYLACSKEKCRLNYINNWLWLFVKIDNKEKVLNA